VPVPVAAEAAEQRAPARAYSAAVDSSQGGSQWRPWWATTPPASRRRDTRKWFGGLLVHAAAQTDSGFIVFDVFESEEAFDRFRELASPIATEAGIEEPPKASPVHTFIST
jgi:hypothetical protein